MYVMGMPCDDYLISLTYGVSWAIWFCSVGGRIFADLISMMPPEGNILTAQDKSALYTYLKWRGEQRGVGYILYHVQNFSPPILQELKVEEHFHGVAMS